MLLFADNNSSVMFGVQTRFSGFATAHKPIAAQDVKCIYMANNLSKIDVTIDQMLTTSLMVPPHGKLIQD